MNSQYKNIKMTFRQSSVLLDNKTSFARHVVAQSLIPSPHFLAGTLNILDSPDARMKMLEILDQGFGCYHLLFRHFPVEFSHSSRPINASIGPPSRKGDGQSCSNRRYLVLLLQYIEGSSAVFGHPTCCYLWHEPRW